MKIPKTLNFQGMKIKVVETDSATDIRLGNNNGKTNWDYGMILLERDLKPDHKARVFLEELVHLIFHEFGRYDEADDEKLVQMITSGLFAIIRQNNLDFRV